MSKAYSPSDYTSIQPNYTTGFGYYTDKNAVSSLLQIPDFGTGTSPTEGDIGRIIKNVEEFIDDKVGHSYRPIIYKDEYHTFVWNRLPYTPYNYYHDYVGFIQLNRPKVRQLLRLEVYQGNKWKNLAGATATVSFSSSTNVGSGVVGINHLSKITLTLPDGDYFNLFAETGIGTALADSEFCVGFGPATAAKELVALINAEYPESTGALTGADSAKSNVSAAGSKKLEDYFFATTDSESSSKVVITSRLMGSDGNNCTITVTDAAGQDSGTSITAFATEGQSGRIEGDWWKIGPEGKIFFRKNYPYIRNHSIRVAYITGDGRVPATIHNAATKLVAAELLRHDDSTILIADYGAQMDIKTKYDELKKDAMEIINGKKWLIALITD